MMANRLPESSVPAGRDQSPPRARRLHSRSHVPAREYQQHGVLGDRLIEHPRVTRAAPRQSFRLVNAVIADAEAPTRRPRGSAL